MNSEQINPQLNVDAELQASQTFSENLNTMIKSGKSFNDAVQNLSFQAAPVTFLQNSFVGRTSSPVPVLSKDQATRDDILTKQAMSTYDVNIMPLLIPSETPNSSTN